MMRDLCTPMRHQSFCKMQPPYSSKFPTIEELRLHRKKSQKRRLEAMKLRSRKREEEKLHKKKEEESWQKKQEEERQRGSEDEENKKVPECIAETMEKDEADEVDSPNPKEEPPKKYRIVFSSSSEDEEQQIAFNYGECSGVRMESSTFVRRPKLSKDNE